MKIIGSLLILCASVCSCVFYEKSEKTKISSAIEVLDFIKHIRAQIEHFCAPLNKIFASYELKSPLIEALIENRIYDAKGFLEKSDFKLIKEYFEVLGKGLKKEELSLSAYTIGELEKSIERKKVDYPSKIKVFRAMALFFGFCVIILII